MSNLPGQFPKAPGRRGNPISVGSILSGAVPTYYAPGQSLRTGRGDPYVPPSRWIEPGRLLAVPKVVFFTSDLRVHPLPWLRNQPDQDLAAYRPLYPIRELPPPRVHAHNFTRGANLGLAPLLDIEDVHVSDADVLLSIAYTGGLDPVPDYAAITTCQFADYRVPDQDLHWVSGDHSVVYDETIEDDDLREGVQDVFRAAAKIVEDRLNGYGFAEVLPDPSDAEIAAMARAQAFPDGRAPESLADLELVRQAEQRLDERPVDIFTPLTVPTDEQFLGVDFLHIHIGDPGFNDQDVMQIGSEETPRDRTEDVLAASIAAARAAAPRFRRFAVKVWMPRRRLPEFTGYPEAAPQKKVAYYTFVNDYPPIEDPNTGVTFPNHYEDSFQLVPVQREEFSAVGYVSPPGGGLVNPDDDDSLQPLSYGSSLCHNRRDYHMVPTDDQLAAFRAGRSQEEATLRAQIDDVNTYYARREEIVQRMAIDLPEYVEDRGSELPTAEELAQIVLDHFAQPYA
jgi:hypothetical protein